MARWGFAMLTLVLLSALSASAQAPMAITQRGQTTHYRLELQIGPEEKMFSKADVPKMHPTSGEVMAGGSMAMGGTAMTGRMAMDTRHLEVHVTNRATGKVVTNAVCRITVTPNTTKKSEAIPVAMMYGIKEGPADWHYGNNVTMPPGGYTVTVVVNGEKAVFRVTIPNA